MARQRQIRFGREGIYYLMVVIAVLVGATARQLNLLMLLGSMLAGPLLFSLIYGRWALRRIEVTRNLPSQLCADQRLVVDVRATNLRRWLTSWAIQVEDSVVRLGAIQRREQKTTVSVFFPALAPGETKQVAYDGRLPQAGKYRFGPLRISTRFPLGLIRHSLVLEETIELIVHPKLGVLKQDLGRVIRDSPAGSHSLSRRGLLAADFYGLRDWRPGDSRRAIHWRTSARRGSLVVRQFEQRRSQDLVILADLWQPLEPTDQQIDNVATAVSCVSTLIAEATRYSGRHLVLHLAGAERLSRSGTVSAVFFREQMDALAVVSPHHEPQLPSWLGHAAAAAAASLPIVVISTRPIDQESLEMAIAERSPPSARRSLVCIDVSGDELAQYFVI